MCLNRFQTNVSKQTSVFYWNLAQTLELSFTEIVLTISQQPVLSKRNTGCWIPVSADVSFNEHQVAEQTPRRRASSWFCTFSRWVCWTSCTLTHPYRWRCLNSSAIADGSLLFPPPRPLLERTLKRSSSFAAWFFPITQALPFLQLNGKCVNGIENTS